MLISTDNITLGKINCFREAFLSNKWSWMQKLLATQGAEKKQQLNSAQNWTLVSLSLSLKEWKNTRVRKQADRSEMSSSWRDRATAIMNLCSCLQWSGTTMGLSKVRLEQGRDSRGLMLLLNYWLLRGSGKGGVSDFRCSTWWIDQTVRTVPNPWPHR